MGSNVLMNKLTAVSKRTRNITRWVGVPTAFNIRMNILDTNYTINQYKTCKTLGVLRGINILRGQYSISGHVYD